MIQKKPRTTYRRAYGRSTGRSSKAYVARIARNVIRRSEETKCFTQTVVAAATNVSTSWQYNSIMAGLVQGVGTNARVGSKISIVALEFFIAITPSTANMDDNGTACRVVLYHNKACGGQNPSTSELWDNNDITTGRYVNYQGKYSILEDITHQMVIFSRDSSGKYSSGPQLNKLLRVTPRTTVEYGGNVGTISDLPKDDFGIGFIADGTNCCTMKCVGKVWFKDS